VAEPVDPSLESRWRAWAQGSLGGTPGQVDGAVAAAVRVGTEGGRQTDAIAAAERAWQEAGKAADAPRPERASAASMRVREDRGIAETREPGANVLDPQAVLSQARAGDPPAAWRVFTTERGRVRGFLRGTSDDPDPLLVITPDGVVEYMDSRKPIAVVDFNSLRRINLRVTGSTFSDSIHVRLDVWLDLHYRDGRKSKWRSASFAGRYETVQAFIEAYGAHRVLGLA
jgi:hypothetical protein